MSGPADAQPVPLDSSTTAPPRLRRVLGLWDLVFYGIVLIQPVGAIGIFGIADKNSFGHVSATIVIALVAMMLTAVSYGRMAGLYPTAGSAYTYVGRGLNPHLGFMAGWCMFLDYLVIPIVSVIYGAKSALSLVNGIFPALDQGFMAGHSGYVVWVVLFTGIATVLNLRGIKWTAGANLFLTAIMFLAIGIFIFDAVKFLWTREGWNGLLSVKPFYDSKTFDFKAVGTATSLAALTYVGFDGITTLSEDVREPKRTVPLAIVLVCVVIGLCAVAQMYLAQQIWPDYTTFKDLDTAFFEVCSKVGGKFLFNAISLIMAVACLGSALTGQVGAARILFGMGRDNALPRFFARVDKHNNPTVNILLIGGLVLVGSLTLKYEDSADLVNFGAFLAFMGVNAAVIREFSFLKPEGHQRNWLIDFVVPGLGFVFCLWLWVQLPLLAKEVGGTWCVAGLIYTGIKTRGFTRQPVMIDLNG